MIVKCERCQTRFKIPDEKVTDKGVKVRCTKCQHTFRVAREDSPSTTPARTIGTRPSRRSSVAPSSLNRGVVTSIWSGGYGSATSQTVRTQAGRRIRIAAVTCA